MEERPTLQAIYNELLKGLVYECALTEKGHMVDGLSEGQKVFIDPRYAIVDTLIHELLHRMYPGWSETRVRRNTLLFMSRMREADLKRFYRAYRRLKKYHPPIELV
jgi:hypothetical protein